MKQYVCSICSYTYDEVKGIPEAGIAPGTRWEELPEDWKCPLCGADKSQFREKTEQAKPAAAPDKPHVEKKLSAMEMNIICSNLARGCEKQYLPRQAEDFRKLAEFFRAKAEPVQEPGTKNCWNSSRMIFRLAIPMAMRCPPRSPIGALCGARSGAKRSPGCSNPC